LTFKDIEGSLETFSGNNHANIKKWISDFEEMAELCKWSDIRKVAYAKRLLTGSAKKFVMFEKNTKTWKQLKKALKSEFSEVIDSHKIHQELSKRKKRQTKLFKNTYTR
jgi:hypothetical protein